MLRALLTLAFAAGTLSPAAMGQSQGPARIEIDVSNFKFAPATISLQHNHPYVLHFVNKSGGSHNFVAGKFFSAANIAPEDRKLVSKGAVDLSGQETLDIHLVAPAAGRYKAHCSHFMHSTFGMTASIVVS